MKTVKADAGRDKRKDDRFDMALKRRAARLPAYGAKGLTCAEAQVDLILSEGEST